MILVLVFYLLKHLIVSPGVAVDTVADVMYIADSGANSLYATNSRGEWLVPLVKDNSTLGISR